MEINLEKPNDHLDKATFYLIATSDKKKESLSNSKGKT